MTDNLGNIDLSSFEEVDIDSLCKKIQNVYLSDHRPWIIGYSGGKDSTATLQLVWKSLEDLEPDQRFKKIYVISSDTLVENPIMMSHINSTLEKINITANNNNMPFVAQKVTPKIEDSFWVNLIGKGYPAPTRSFRWCTERLKIRPTNDFIKSQVDKYGEVVVVLGVRKSESASRAKIIEKHKMKGTPLSRHTYFPQAFVFTPIENLSTEAVWNILFKVPSPWEENNKKLLSLYEKANAKERVFILDDSAPATGSGRFGCWICTLVEKDNTMEALIENGNEWLKPLNELRDLLSKTTIPDNKPIYREHKRLNGKIQFKSDGSGDLIRGPYKFSFCKQILKMLLLAQTKLRMNESCSNINLILPEEIHEIRKIWRMDRGDWEDSLPEIYRANTGEDLEWVQEDKGSFSQTEENLLREICEQEDIPVRLVMKLFDVEKKFQGMRRRTSIYSKIEAVLKEEWRSEEEILSNT